MGDMGDYWREAKEHRRKTKAKSDAEIRSSLLPKWLGELKAIGVGYRILATYPEHYRLIDGAWNELADWWPTTGTWIAVGGKRGSGIRSLIKHLRTPSKGSTHGEGQP